MPRGLRSFHKAQRRAEDVAALIDLLALRLFRRHVLYRAHQQTGGDIDVISDIDLSGGSRCSVSLARPKSKTFT